MSWETFGKVVAAILALCAIAMCCSSFNVGPPPV